MRKRVEQMTDAEYLYISGIDLENDVRSCSKTDVTLLRWPWNTIFGKGPRLVD